MSGVDLMRSVLTFLRDDRGSQTIEFVLWLPIIGALLVIISYASILYTTHTEMWNVARDTARRMTTGLFDVNKVLDEAAAEEYAQSQLKLYEIFGAGYLVEATEDPVAETMTVVITLGVTDGSFDAGFFGAFSLVGGTLGARVVARAEPTT
jgi:Flp pilus assembly protein TadG